MSFEKLKRFRISIGCKLAKLKYKEEYSFRNTIQFSGDCDELLECKISDLFEKTEELCLTVNGMNHFEDHSFSNLTVLHVSECADLIYLFTVDVASSLKRLERLTISNCPVMKTFIAENSRVGVIRFQKLNYMSLTNLPQMVRFWDNEIELPEMVELIVKDLPNFTSIYPYSHNNTFEMQSLLNEKVVIPKLKKLDISRMVNLKQIWSCKVTTEKNNLLPSSPLALLNHLEELKVKECGSIEVLFNIDLEGVGGIVELGCRLRSITVNGLGKLKVLWRMKGANQSSILINCFKSVESIEITNCYEYVTPNTNKEILKGEITELNDYIPKVTYPSYLLHTCHHLRHLELENDKRVEEVVFDMDTQPPLLLPYLERIDLVDLKEMSHVWKCNNWNKLILHHQPPPLQFPFQNLTDIFLSSCHNIKYLFSPLMAKYLSNLKRVDISWCDGIEEVISRRDDEENSTSASSYQDTTLFFPHLDALVLRYLPCLESVDKSQSGQVTDACWSLCQYPTKIYIEKCDALSSLIPWYALGQMERLQELVINECSRMTQVFNINVDDEGGAHGTSPTTLKNINPQFSNLKEVRIFKCDLLSHLFTFSTLESLKQLEKLRVISCKAIQVIVKEENSTAGGIKSSKDHVVVFPRLKTLELEHLPNLKGFFLGMNIEFQWPLLDNVMIDGCPELMMFTSGQSKAPKLKYIRTGLGRHSLESCGINFNRTINEYQTTFPNSSSSSSSSSDLTISNGMRWSFHNLIQIKTFLRDVGRASIIPFNVLPQLQKLQQISISNCHGVKEVFEVVALELEGSGFNESVKIPNLTQLELSIYGRATNGWCWSFQT